MLGIPYWTMFHLDSCGQWLISLNHLFPTICRDQQWQWRCSQTHIDSVSSSDVQSPLFRPECAAALHSMQPCCRDSSQCQINHSAICVDMNANLSLPLSAANLNIWCVGVIFFFFPRALFTICTRLTESVQAGFNRTSQSGMCTAINGFSVMLNKQNGILCSMKWLFALGSHTGREEVEEAKA